MYFHIYQTRWLREWRWRLIAKNGKIIATSGEGYRNFQDCLAMINKIKVEAHKIESREESSRKV